MLHWIKNKFHIHKFNKPIVSRYVSFHQRDIVYECKCGERKIKRIFKQYGEAFPIETSSLLSYKEMNNILNKK